MSPKEIHRQVAWFREEAERSEVQLRELTTRARVARVSAGRLLGLQGEDFEWSGRSWFIDHVSSKPGPPEIPQIRERWEFSQGATSWWSLYFWDPNCAWGHVMNPGEVVLDPDLNFAAFSSIRVYGEGQRWRIYNLDLWKRRT